MEKKLTIRDIARLSGVAKSTVSRYLNGGSVREETGQKIKKVIEAYHYEPNVFARLNAKSSRIIGLIVPGFDSIVTPGLVEVIVAYLKRYDYTPLIMHTGNDLAEEIKSIERLTAINADGIMVLASSVTGAHKTAVEKANLPVLFLGQRYLQGNSVINDDYHAGLELGRYLGARGAVRVAALWVSEADEAVGKERKRGVQDGLYIYSINYGMGSSTFTMQPDLCYRIRDGRICQPIRVNVITGNVFQTLFDIDAVGDDLEIFDNFSCSKGGQTVQVSAGGPTIRVRRLTVN